MKGFKKLALVSAIAALPMSGFAMEALDDATMSDVTGQDGIRIGLSLNQSMNILIDDTDGLDTGTGPATHTGPGGIYIAGAGATGTATVDIDAGGNGTNGVLLVQVDLANGFMMTTGDLHAVNTSAGGGAFSSNAGANTAPNVAIMESTNITFAAGLNLDIQLGEGAANFLTINGNAGTIRFGNAANAADNFVLNDVAGGGAVRAGELAIGGLDLTGTTASITTSGLSITMGANLTAVTVTLTDLSLGNAVQPVLGDVYITGLNMAGDTITIAGKTSP